MQHLSLPLLTVDAAWLAASLCFSHRGPYLKTVSQISPPSLKLLCQISRYSKGKVVDKPAFVPKLKRHGPCVSLSPRWTRDLCRMSLGLGWTILLMKMGARAAARAQPPDLSHQGLFCSLCVSCLLLYNKLPHNLVFPKQQRFISSQFEWVWL